MHACAGVSAYITHREVGLTVRLESVTFTSGDGETRVRRTWPPRTAMGPIGR